ncbi:MAG: FkbM family methyltransferase [Candidatus Acidiferrales bacterium]
MTRSIRRLATFLARSIPTPVRRLVRCNRAVNRFVRGSFVGALGNVVTIESGPMAGIKLAVSEHISHKYIRGVYELETQFALDRLLKNGVVCYDLGASIGYMSLLMARRAKTVYAFEPAPHAAAEIRRHAEVNGFTNIKVIPNPVSNFGTRGRVLNN